MINLNRIAVLEVDGVIGLGASQSDVLFGKASTGADDFDKIVDDLVKRRWIKGIVLRVNSPGGGALAADRMYNAINRLKESGKTVYTSMGNIAASGGYYVAVNSDRLYANMSTLTGSIGVISSHINFMALHQELGVKNDTLKTGKYMDIYSQSKPLSADERLILQHRSNFVYKTFVDKVKQNRLYTDTEVYNVAQGQIYTGSQALELNMIDEIGGFYDTVDDLATSLDIDNPELVYYRRQSSLMSGIANNSVIKKVKTSLSQSLSMYMTQLFSPLKTDKSLLSPF